MNNSIDVQYFKKLINIYNNMDDDSIARYARYKSEYYRLFSYITIIIGSVADVGYLVSDYLINGTLWPVIIPRVSILLFLALYLILERKVSNYKIKIMMNYTMVHIVLWSTMITVYFLRDKTHFAEGSYTLNMFLFAIGLGARPGIALLNYLIFFGEILLTDLFNHYPNLDIMMSLNIPVCIGILVGLWALNLTTLDHYLTENMLNDALVTDNLTKVGNRDKLDMIVKDNKLKGMTGPATISMIDVDLFKDINDTYGHEMGDFVLSYLGNFMREYTRVGDTIIRYGGEEFVIIMDKCPVDDGFERLDRMREELSMRRDRPVDFTISIGVSEYTEEFDQDLREADSAMYDAKRAGRNKVCRADRNK